MKKIETLDIETVNNLFGEIYDQAKEHVAGKEIHLHDVCLAFSKIKDQYPPISSEKKEWQELEQVEFLAHLYHKVADHILAIPIRQKWEMYQQLGEIFRQWEMFDHLPSTVKDTILSSHEQFMATGLQVLDKIEEFFHEMELPVFWKKYALAEHEEREMEKFVARYRKEVSQSIQDQDWTKLSLTLHNFSNDILAFSQKTPTLGFSHCKRDLIEHAKSFQKDLRKYEKSFSELSKEGISRWFKQFAE
jgi:hypothetical protein